MAQLDELEQKIMLDGDKEVLSSLQEIGKQGAEALEKLAEAASKGLGPLETLGGAIGIIAAGIISLTGAVTAWADVNIEAVQRTKLLGDAFGLTAGEMAGLEAAFAQAGVGLKQFEVLAQRLTVTIAREWPAITENVRTAGTEQESAQNRITQSILRIADAQNKLQTVSEETDSKITNAAIREAEAQQKLQFAAEEAYATMIHGINSVQGANLSLEQAEQRLATLEGRPPSESDKKSLELKQAQLAVDQARQASEDALRKQQEDQAAAALKQQKLEQEAADASLRRQTAEQEAVTARAKAELAVKEAINARAEAEERANQQALKSIPAITKALEAVRDGNKDLAKTIDLGEVSVRNLVNSVIKLAAAGRDVKPTGYQVLRELSQLLKSDTDHLIDAEQRLAIVQQLSQRGFNTTSQSAAEMLAVIERGPGEWDKYTEAQKKAFSETDLHNVERFRDAITHLGFSFDQLNRQAATAISPALISLLEKMNESLSDQGGVLHTIIDLLTSFARGVGVVANIFVRLVEAANDAFKAIDKIMVLPEGSTLKVVITGILATVAAIAPAFLAIPIVVALVVTAVGELSKVVGDNKLAWELVAIAIGAIIGLIAPIPTLIGLVAASVVYVVNHWKEVVEWVSKAVDKVKEFFGVGKSKSTASNDNAPTNNYSTTVGEAGDVGQGFASGGHVRGPGSGTSDSIPARLSNGEFVMRAASVQKFGVDFFHALNNMMIPGFASGGLVGTPSRVGVPSSIQASRPLNLTIDGHTFNGLRGPKNVVDSLASYAVARQTASAGVKPTWVK
jgi:hypothetical protein